MGLRETIRPRLQDWAMRQLDDLRPEALAPARGEVLEVGFGTGLNLRHYGAEVRSLTGLDPMRTDGVALVAERISRAPFPVTRAALRADTTLPFDAGRFDCVVTTWTLCSIPDPLAALAEMHRVLRAGGRYVFIEHGRSERERTARWQDRLNPAWRRIADGSAASTSSSRAAASSCSRSTASAPADPPCSRACTAARPCGARSGTREGHATRSEPQASEGGPLPG
jgi:SAM-dependent methyltransferase